jgi:hypothetical protein
VLASQKYLLPWQTQGLEVMILEAAARYGLAIVIRLKASTGPVQATKTPRYQNNPGIITGYLQI